MSSMTFFAINGTDLTAYADIQNFSVNQTDIYQEWTDGNWIDHREITRQRITGSFQLGFSDSTAWNSFLALIAAEKLSAGYFPVTVYVNNLGSTQTINAFLDMSAAAKWDLVNDRFWKTITVTLTER